MGINVTEMQRLAGVVPTDDGYHSYRQAVGSETLGEDIATGAKGWLSGVMKALGTWKGKMQKGGASPAQMSALDGVEAAIRAAMGKLGEGVEGLDADDAIFEDAVPAYVAGGDLDAFNTALAKLCGKLKKDLGAESIRQNYKGTGKQKHRRQLYVHYMPNEATDLWLDDGFARIGGVIFMPFADKSAIPYEGKTPQDVYDELLKRMKAAKEKIVKAKAVLAAQGKDPSGATAAPQEALESVGRDDFFGDHLNWARALLGEASDEPQHPTKKELDALTQAYAIYKVSQKAGASASVAQQKKLYDRYMKALDKVLAKLKAQTLSAENQAALDAKADAWLKTQTVQGAGKWW